eukprot:290334-Hanusia_phi.AAC.3
MRGRGGGGGEKERGRGGEEEEQQKKRRKREGGRGGGGTKERGRGRLGANLQLGMRDLAAVSGQEGHAGLKASASPWPSLVELPRR